MHKQTMTLTLAAGLLVGSFTASKSADAPAKVAEIAALIDASKTVDAKLKTFAKEKLIPALTNPVIVQSVKDQNARKVTLDEIRKTDAEWQAAKDLPIQKERMGNACAGELAKLAAANPAIAEAFVTDNQGANVGQNALTTDYWQGDEPKWTGAFNEGKGGLDAGEVKMDKSAGKVLQQISMPIIDTDGTVVGTVTFGVILEKI
jgi:hypothetical protein